MKKIIFFFISFSLVGQGTVFFTNVGFGTNEELVKGCSPDSTLYKIKKMLQEYGYMLEPYDEKEPTKTSAHYLISFNLSPQVKNINAFKKIAILWEPPTIYSLNFDKTLLDQYDLIFTWDDNLVDNKKFFKFCGEQKQLAIIPEPVVFDKKKLCTLINNNKYSPHPSELYTERRNALTFFEQHAAEHFEFYGTGWDRNKHPRYGGIIDDKIDYLKQYKFCICYENMKDVRGYITEKLFDCFKAGCVPIYWGADNVLDYIPAGCFIDRRDFKSYEELYRYISSMDKNVYNRCIENINQFFASHAAYIFSQEYFLNIFMQHINPHPQVRLQFLSRSGHDIKKCATQQIRYKKYMSHKNTFVAIK